MEKIAIVTDSTADLPAALVRELDITVVPLEVHFGEEIYKDWIDLGPRAFFEKLTSSPVHPRTSQPSPAEFEKAYRQLLERAATIFSIHISAQLSGTYQSAVLAKGMLPGADIEVLDSKTASMGLGLVVLEAARAAQQGLGRDSVKQRVTDTVNKMNTLLTVDTLDYLHRNGRIGRAQHLMGTLLNVKPILEVDRDGVVAPLDKVRGRQRVIPRLVELARERVGAGASVKVAVIHANAPERAQELARAAAAAFEVKELYTSELGAVIGTHVGPGTIGFAFFPT
ncbi:MAG: DegV family protein [Firmicutes bacterium]|nr:DegV family protein [Bacillota bacterium]MCL5038326.1 DegV family protein [Bacillota bacterium]